ncbi:histidine phosphatase family protein [Ideonella sp. A 288]|uniref:histidine phosphatase family protein n=1 Tax=Ideonella sp. A 288 TaxID=1962181 RepID=UPI000B4B2B6C|nr:histidine phosphatase family protein [Ideonella sp. A 288]
MLHLVRHGETPLNVARVLQPADTPLSERGRAQALAIAQRLVPMGLAGIVSSDLPRARQTAQAIADACGLAIETSPLLQERNFGDLRGQPYDALGFDPLVLTGEPPGGESVATFEARVRRAWQHVLQRQAAIGGPIAVVSHGLVLRAWLQPDRVDLGAQVLPDQVANTSLSSVEPHPPHRVLTLACALHLRGTAGHDGRSLVGG